MSPPDRPDPRADLRSLSRRPGADAADAQQTADRLFPRLSMLLESLGAETLYSMKPDIYGLVVDEVTRELGAGVTLTTHACCCSSSVTFGGELDQRV